MNRALREFLIGAALLACGWLATSTEVLAEPLGPEPKTLAIAEGVLSYCTKVDPAAAAKYQDKVKQLVQGASDEVLAKVRSSAEYQQARASVDEFVSKVDEHNAKRVCSNGAAPKQRGAAHQ